MDKATKVALAYVLGEVFRIQKRIKDVNGHDICNVSNATIYGLLQGVESIIEEVIPTSYAVTKQEFGDACDILDEIWRDPQKVAAFNGYYDILDKFEAKGIDRMKAIHIFSIMRDRDQFIDIINKLDSSGSPNELRRPEIDPRDV
jgi:hypothetical protein